VKRSVLQRTRFACVVAAIAAAAAARADEAPAGHAHRHHAAKLSETSTLAQWKAASASDRSEVAVAIARAKLAPTATKLEVATAAMEISGCLTATARDSRFEAWQVAPTATTCLTAPERPAAKADRGAP
jgi:hypothetical protein